MTFASRKLKTFSLSFLASLIGGAGIEPLPAIAQPMIRKSGVVPQGVPAGAVVQPGQPGQPNAAPGQPPDGAKPADPSKPGEKTDSAPTARPTKPPAPPNPDEIKNLKPDELGRVKFNLKGQPWGDVLEWLAEASHKSLDWQELPPDYLNLVTQQTYSIDEARGLLNRHLLARGFTMLTHGETISVVNVAKINPGIVPRVEPSELERLPDHDYVKTSFPLDWLLSDQAETELKPMLSPNGKLTHLTATNRLEAMDSVTNLRQIWTVLQEEQSGGKQAQLVREFKLKHTKAVEVLDQLHILLGMNKPNPKAKRAGGGGGGGGMDPNMMGQFQQQMQQMMQQMQQQAQQGQGGAAKAKPAEVRLLANDRENSILANAPPDKMAIITQAVKTLDVVASHGENLLQNVQRMQVYRLTGIDPDSLMQLLDEVGNLDPTTKLQADTKNKSIVAYASLADHMTIRMLVEKLDGTNRRFQVIPLRKLGADYVAGTIEFMMGGQEKDKNSGRSNPYYFDYYNPYGSGRNSSKDDGGDKFKVDADVENNRLLLFANEIEIREIENLLMKLGELPPAGGNRNTQRYIDNLDPEDAEQLLERIRRVWPGMAPNELIIDESEPTHPAKKPEDVEEQEVAPKKKAPKKDPSKSASESLKSDATKKTSTPKKKTPPPAKDLKADVGQPNRSGLISLATNRTLLVSNQLALSDEVQAVTTDTPEEKADDDSGNSANKPDSKSLATPQARRPQKQSPLPAPVRIRRGPDGRLMLESDDTAALDQLEDLLHEAAPPKRDYKIFYLKYSTTWAYSVELSLKDFFDEEKKKSGSNYNPYFGFRLGGNEEKDTTRRLSKRKPLKFISDSDSGTIIVQGADAAQLKTIQELIEIYDRPPSTDGKQVRMTETYTLKYAKAPVVAEAIKDVYRDLLSANDKAYQNQKGKDGQKPPEKNYTFVYGGGGSDDKGGKTQETPVKFKGLLSVGVDEVSNTIIISAPEGMLENVAELIERLEKAARPTNTVQVVQINSRQVNSAELQKRLAKIFKTPKPPQQKQNQQQQMQQQQAQENSDEPVIVP